MRASEQVAEGRINSIKESDEKIKGGLQTAGKLASTAVGLGAGAAISSKIAPFLSEYITPEIALKGISKVSPKFGEALKKGMESGLTLESGLDFLKQSMEKPKEKKENKMSGENILSQYSPELRTFIEDQIDDGISPTEAVLRAMNDANHKKVIDQITKDHKLDENFGFFNLVKELYGTPKGEQQEQPQPQQMQQPQQNQPQAQNQPQQQGGQGQQALMSILQKIQQARGG